MKLLARSVAVTVVLSLLLAGPLAPLAAAQQPAPQPDLMQEALKTTQRTESGSKAYEVGAGLANVAYVPGKAFVCGLGIGVGAVLLLVSLGSGYRAAAAAGEEGCGGKWALTADDLRPAPMTGEGRAALVLRPPLGPRAARWLVAALFVALLAAFGAGIWGTIVRPPAYEVRGTVAARPAPDLLLVNHEAVAALGMRAMQMMAVVAEPALLDAADPKPGDRVRLAVRPDGDRIVLLRIEKE